MGVPEAIRRLVRQRADGRCEYCRMRERWNLFERHHIEHIQAQQHGGGDDPENLALACNHCNFLKGPNLSSIDPDGCEQVSLFNPRVDRWDDHFRLDGKVIAGLTARGRTTVFLLDMNEADRVQLRSRFIHDW